MNRRLRDLFEQDQADRAGGLLHEGADERDDRRRAEVEALLGAGAATSPEDWYHAAMVFQHGHRREHYRRAHELAARAAERAAWDVPPLAGALRRAEDRTCQEPPW